MSVGNTKLVALLMLESCNCNDTCGAASLTHAPFRHGQSLQAYVRSDLTESLNSSDSVNVLYIVNSLFLVFIIFHGLLGVLETSFTQSEFRNKIFLVVAGETTWIGRRTAHTRLRYHLGKAVALSFYLSAISVAFGAPVIFLSSMIVNEISTFYYPTAENSDAVGQASRLIGFCLATTDT